MGQPCFYWQGELCAGWGLPSPSAAYAGTSCTWEQQSQHYRVPPPALSLAEVMEGVTIPSFISVFELPATKHVVCCLCQLSLCITLAASLPDLPEGQSCPKRLCSTVVGAARGLTMLMSERCACWYKLMEIGLERTQLMVINLAGSL